MGIAFAACWGGAVPLGLAQESGTERQTVPPPPELRPVPDFRISVADTDTRVFIANVNLRIGDLILTNGDDFALTGTYEIDVPLRSSKDQIGGLVLPLEHPVSHYLEEGGILTGKGRSFEQPEIAHSITCEVEPDPKNKRIGKIRLLIDTGNRVMEFDTTYEVIGEIPDFGKRSVVLRTPGEVVAATFGNL